MLYAPGDLFQQVVAASQHRWTHNEELLALLLEKLDQLVILTAQIWSDKKSRPPTPFRYPRPFPPEPQRPATLSEIRLFFAR